MGFSVTVIDSVFTSNSAGGASGWSAGGVASFVEKSRQSMTATNSIFTLNSAKEGGVVNKGDATFTGCTLTSNFAKSAGKRCSVCCVCHGEVNKCFSQISHFIVTGYPFPPSPLPSFFFSPPLPSTPYPLPPFSLSSPPPSKAELYWGIVKALWSLLIHCLCRIVPKTVTQELRRLPY